MKKIAFYLMLSSSFLAVSCQDGGKQFKPSSEDEKTLYTVGAMLGERFAQLGLSEKEVKAISQGLQDSALKKELQVDLVEYQPKITNFFNEKMSQVSEKVRVEGDAFRKKFSESEGAQVTESGLVYKIENAGSGKKPKETDTVSVSYHGTLIDGTVFDSSVDRGQDVEFPLNRVIRGWTEGVQLIGVGGKIRLVIPPELAYGDAGAPPAIPGGATLIFDVELKAIVEGAAEK